jgi:hypothetical protein
MSFPWIAMTLIEIFLPLFDPQGARFPRAMLDEVKSELTDRFGGVTAFARSPAEGQWLQGGSVANDTLIVCEVMVESVDSGWWRNYLDGLARRFGQQEMLARATAVRKL